MCLKCGKPTHARNLCHTHYAQAWRQGFPPKPTHCKCGIRLYAQNLCQKHYMRDYRAGRLPKRKKEHAQ